MSAYFVPGIIGRHIREQHKVLPVVELNFNGGQRGYQETKLIRKRSTWINAIQRVKTRV